MTGLLLVLLGSLSLEAGSSIGKYEVQKGRQSIYMMGFLDSLWGTLLFVILLRSGIQEWHFSMAIFPVFCLRIILEVFQAHVCILALTRADRSTFGFIRIGTIPLLLTVDVLLGYAIGLSQIAGIALIVCSLLLLLARRGMRMNGIVPLVICTVNAVITISLFKYNITHGNSVGAEQSIALLVLLLYFSVMTRAHDGKNPALFLRNPVLILQSLTVGIGTVLSNIGYVFLPASIATTVGRAVALLWAVASGNLWFKEKSLALKILAALLCTGGLALLAR